MSDLLPRPQKDGDGMSLPRLPSPLKKEPRRGRGEVKSGHVEMHSSKKDGARFSPAPPPFPPKHTSGG
jgi:hypothetical protein